MLRRPSQNSPNIWQMADDQRVKWLAHVCTCKHHPDGGFEALDSVPETPDEFFEKHGQLRVLDNGLLKLKFEVWCPNDGCNYQLYFCKLAGIVDWRDPHEF